MRCTDRDPYADYAGALKCLREKGDVAFLNDKARIIWQLVGCYFSYLLPWQDDGTFQMYVNEKFLPS